MDKDDRTDLLRLGKKRLVEKREYVCKPAESGKQVYVLERGRVKLFHISLSGKDMIMGFCLPGEIFGMPHVFLNGATGENPMFAQASEDCEIRFISHEQFHSYLVTHPNTALLIIETLSRQVRDLSDKLLNISSVKVLPRIAKLLLHLGISYGVREAQIVRLDIPISHQDIADMSGATRQTVSGVLGTLRQQGILRISRQRIDILDEAQLNQIAAANKERAG